MKGIYDDYRCLRILRCCSYFLGGATVKEVNDLIGLLDDVGNDWDIYEDLDIYYDLTRITLEAIEIGVTIYLMPENVKMNSMPGVHLKLPTEKELYDALDKCQRDGFERIYIHC